MLHPVDPNSISGQNGGTYPNLFCAHPPFQIDGNFGGAAGIAEMFLQTHGKNYTIRFLPALPSHPDWKKGSMQGMKARNGFEVSFNWEKHRLKTATITSLNGADCSVLLPAGKSIYYKENLLIHSKKKTEVVSFPTEKGATYSIQ